MGAYLSSPITDKVSSDTSGEHLICGASSMQGWRVTQEDAHNCILDYEGDASLFAVYDGHGGKEVAEYTAINLPNFIKDTESYKNGDFVQALKDAFIKFDASLKEPEVLAILKEIAGTKDENQSETDDENLGNLQEEAQMPLEQVMAKYTSSGTACNSNILTVEGERKKMLAPISPFLRARGCRSSANKGESSSSASSSKNEGCSSASSSHTDKEDMEVSSTSTTAVPNQPDISVNGKNELDPTSTNGVEESSPINENSDSIKETPVKGNNTIHANQDSSELDCNKSSEPNKKAVGNDPEVPDSSDDSVVCKSEKEISSEVETESKHLVNGDSTNHKSESKEDVTSSSVENGEVKGKGKGKRLVKFKIPEKKEDETPEQLFKKFVDSGAGKTSRKTPSVPTIDPAPESSDSESEDATFHGPDSTSEDDGADEIDEENESNDEDEEDDDDDDDEEEDSEECDEDDGCCGSEFTANMTDEPGYDSGCTAVMALVKNKKLYVANAGDSRCVVSKNGEVVEMSFDHKPEDEPEMERIMKAGGKVTCDGRVNGGLNLSRALGDHVYKLVPNLAPEEQMISPLPDVKVIDIDDDVEFMVLACDGIWNFMSSKEVIDFVRPRLLEKRDKISTICEELFDHCLAPNTLGDGTGCDNMTAVIVEFRNSITLNPDSNTKKRRASESEVDDFDHNKKHKTEGDTNATDVSSSDNSKKDDSSKSSFLDGNKAQTDTSL